jgi:hypothetical protein
VNTPVTRALARIMLLAAVAWCAWIYWPRPKPAGNPARDAALARYAARIVELQGSLDDSQDSIRVLRGKLRVSQERAEIVDDTTYLVDSVLVVLPAPVVTRQRLTDQTLVITAAALDTCSTLVTTLRDQDSLHVAERDDARRETKTAKRQGLKQGLSLGAIGGLLLALIAR